ESEAYESSSEDEGGSSDESSEDETPALVRPVFIPKSKRGAASASPAVEGPSAAELAAEKERKKEATLQFIEDEVRREQAALARANIHEANAVEDVAGIDDTDDVDPAAELAAWKLRELRRVQRERDELAAAEAEREEIERRRNMDEDDKLREDLERVRQQREDKRSRGTIKFLQKYYHKGAFYQDMDILKRDFNGELEDDVRDKTLLPKAMQVRGDQFGKRGRSKWTHLLAEDTSAGVESPWFER
ncbi:micro-fibrillar-associated protein 1, partial [Dipodascopsis tothii]|uniref:micro-fibrillar-associated protein 1 n=1 Tax=Dipodascopsis tothii TaxID=44089 RepID=UPI0034CD72B7